jgi:methionyl-tRNA formyltransferase
MSLKIIFMGTPEFAVPALKELLKEKLNIIYVYTQPPKKSNRGLKIEKTPVHLKKALLIFMHHYCLTGEVPHLFKGQL